MAFFDDINLSNLQNNPLMQLSLGLLRSSGPQPTPHSFGQDLASSYDYMTNAQGKNFQNQYLKAHGAALQAETDRQKNYQNMFQPPQGDAGSSGGVLAPPAPMAGILSDPRIAPLSPLLQGMTPDKGMELMAKQLLPKDSGGATGELVDRYMKATGLPFDQALYAVQTGMRQGLAMQNGVLSPMSNAPEAKGALSYGEAAGKEKATLDFARPIAQQKKLGENQADNQQVAMNSQDIVGLYTKLLRDATTAPSGALESGIASASNLMNMPTEGAKAKGTFDADVNNLFLATIRSLKGTGRVMEQELNQIKESTPKSTDSMAVKITKTEAHLAYYQNRMKELGFDPNSGQPALNNSPDMQGQATPLPAPISGNAQIPNMQVPASILGGVQSTPAGSGLLSGQQPQGQAQQSQMPPGAKMGGDGKFYVPDPNRPGKYLMVQ